MLAAEQPPQLDIEPSCRAAEGAAAVIGRGPDNCRNDERNARGQLERDWPAYTAADKSHCTALVHTGGPASYVELLSCLELARDARRIAQERALGTPPADATTGTAPASGGRAPAR
jgi:hypothetical protein